MVITETGTPEEVNGAKALAAEAAAIAVTVEEKTQL